MDRVVGDLVARPPLGVAVGKDLARLATVESFPRIRVGGEIGEQAQVALLSYVLNVFPTTFTFNR